MGCCQGRSSVEAARDVKVGELKGKVCIVTGPTTGIGLICAKTMAQKGAHVVLAGRSAARMADAEKHIRAAVPGAELTSIVLDLGSFKSVRAFAESFLKLNLPLHFLFNNAGIMAAPYAKTEDGFEVQFQTNGLSHFLLTALLTPKLKASAPARVIFVSSNAAGWTTVTKAAVVFDLDSAHHTPNSAYGNSKLANILHAREFAARLKGSGVSVFSLHPGVFPSELGRNNCCAGCLYTTLGCCMMSVDQGAATSLYCALTPGLEKYSGLYFSDCDVAQPKTPLGNDDALARVLWAQSETMTGTGPVLPLDGGADEKKADALAAAATTAGGGGGAAVAAGESAPLTGAAPGAVAGAGYGGVSG